jgi:hypothetical protein
MKTKHRYLSKSRFKKGLECPTKLFYTGKPAYEDKSQSDSFLEALAEGGYQVGELAKCYYPGCTDIDALNYQESLDQTNELLKQENVIIYEPAFLFQNLFVRVDILVKKGNQIQLIEVKAKSYSDTSEFTGKNGEVSGSWKSYLIDVAFQKHVITQAHPAWNVSACIMLANKNKSCTIEGLNQAFPVTISASNRLKVNHQPLKDYGEPILTAEIIDEEVDKLWAMDYQIGNERLRFPEFVQRLSDAYSTDTFLADGVGGKCKGCEFKSSNDTNGLKNGFHHYWKTMHGLDLTGESAPLVFELTGGRTSKYFNNGINFLKDLPIDEFEAPETGQLSSKNRRYLHLVKTQENDQDLHFEKERFLELKSTVKYPLNMIDFETTRVAIPYHVGMKPYEQIAFQFSHHTISETGEIVHQNEWINTEKGQFPNFEFIRNLKAALSANEGTIFRYSHHENTVLREIHAQLYASSESDRTDLMSFIDDITHVKNGATGKRNMKDLCQWVKETYFDLHTKGSSSLKLILPSILNRSSLLQRKYSEPIYGQEIPSLSIGQRALITKDVKGNIINPYKVLPPVFESIDDDQLDELWSRIADISEGGAAMTAYAKMQFEEIPDREKENITAALLRYCELDTMAMVMLWEGLNDLAE